MEADILSSVMISANVYFWNHLFFGSHILQSLFVKANYLSLMIFFKADGNSADLLFYIPQLFLIIRIYRSKAYELPQLFLQVEATYRIISGFILGVVLVVVNVFTGYFLHLRW